MNTLCGHGCRMAFTATALMLASLGGCKENNDQEKRKDKESSAKSVTVTAFGPASSPVEPTLDQGWCNGHGVPESVCTRCAASPDKFKEAGDWCEEHDLPESQCFVCHPEAEAEWAKLNPANATKTAGGGHLSAKSNAKIPLGPATSPVKPTLDQGWCHGHGVPESVCTRCAASPEKFKAAGDWCEEHDLPESQCFVCHPEVEAEWAKLNPANRKDSQNGDATKGSSGTQGAIRLEPNRRLLTGGSDSQCQVDRLQVRFLDGTTKRKAGIETEVVRNRRISNTIECLAEVSFDQTRLVKITPRVGGVVTEASVEIGTVVNADDVLAVLESPELGLAKSRYISVRESYHLAKADFERVDTIYRGTKKMLEICTASTPSDEVRQQLAEVRIGDAKSRLLQAHSALELARLTLKREDLLHEKKIARGRDIETARSVLASADADFHATSEAVAFETERDRLAAMRSLKVAKSEMDAAARELQILGLSETQLSAIDDESSLSLSRYELRSPAAGRIVERSAVVGEVVQQRNALYTVADLSTMWVIMDLSERDLALVRVGLPVLFTVDGLPGHSFDGTVSWIASTVYDRTRTVKVRANLPNDSGLLRANMFGLARIIIHDNDEVVSVPSEAVQTDGCCQLVFVKQDETIFAPRKVTLGARAHGHVEILAGLTPGESVVTEGSFLMKTEILKSNIGAGCCEVEPGR